MRDDLEVCQLSSHPGTKDTEAEVLIKKKQSEYKQISIYHKFWVSSKLCGCELQVHKFLILDL